MQTFGSCQLIGSTAASHGQNCKDDKACEFFQHFQDRCLAHTSVGTPGLFLLLARWVFCKPQQGGLLSGTETASELLKALVAIVVPALSKRKIAVYGLPDVSLLWPRPSPIHSMYITINTSGLLDLNPIKQVSHGPPHEFRSMLKKWENALGQTANWTWTIPLWDILSLCASKVPQS